MAAIVPIGDSLDDHRSTALYEQRIAVAILSVVVVVRRPRGRRRRRGWSRRCPAPGRTGGRRARSAHRAAPATWYLASPIFIRTALQEPAPAGVAAPSATPSRRRRPPAPADDATGVAPTDAEPDADPFVPATVASGEFPGTDEFHFGQGTASIIELEPGRYHLRLEDFRCATVRTCTCTCHRTPTATPTTPSRSGPQGHRRLVRL